MVINKMVMAGSLESNDVLITLGPSKEDELELVIDSIVKKQFGTRIENIIVGILEEFDVVSGSIRIQDRGALDCTLKARMETAILRAKEDK